jgi:hypothetical protein
LFGVLFFGWPKSATIALGGLWGLVVWVGMSVVVMPLAGVGHLANLAPLGLGLLTHLAYGVAVGIGFLAYQELRPPRNEVVSRQSMAIPQ